MDEQEFRKLISGEKKGFVSSFLRCILAAISLIYGLVVSIRNLLFNWKLRTSHTAKVPIISIGNLTTGGTGKTPTVGFVVKLLQSKAKTPGLISRGYKALKDGRNDEFLLLEQICPGVPHVQNSIRKIAVEELLYEFSDVDCLVLDDAFQHRQMDRQLDIVLVDALNPWGYGGLLPRGLLREPISSLKRADLIAITRIDQVSSKELSAIENKILVYAKPENMLEIIFRPNGFVNSSGNEISSLDDSVIAFCGIGNPEGFAKTIELMIPHFKESNLEVFPDHHHYSSAELEDLIEKAKACKASAFLTTQKDLVKLNRDELGGYPVWAVRIEAEVIQGQENLERELTQILDS